MSGPPGGDGADGLEQEASNRPKKAAAVGRRNCGRSFILTTVAKVVTKLKIILAPPVILLCNPAMNDLERMTKLEERYVHLQRHIAEQDKAMLELGEAIVKLRKEITLLRAQSAGGTSETRDAADERPPHY